MKKLNIYEGVNENMLRAMHNIFQQAACRANHRIGNTINERNESIVKTDGGYKCIHLPPNVFMQDLQGALNFLKASNNDDRFKLKFLDVGCGIGEKIYLASLFGVKSFGLELRKELIAEGKRLFKSMGYGWHFETCNQFIQANALKYNYKDFDILYFYCPLFDGNLQVRLENQIAKTAKSGALVLPYCERGCFSYRLSPPTGWKYSYSTESSVGFFVKD